MIRDYKYFAFTLICDISNELEIDPAELFYQYDFSEEEIEEYYEWLECYTKEQ